MRMAGEGGVKAKIPSRGDFSNSSIGRGFLLPERCVQRDKHSHNNQRPNGK